MKIYDAIPRDWTRLLVPDAKATGIGWDVATTDKGTSNPSGIVVTQRISPVYRQSLAVRFKTASEEVAFQVGLMIVQDIIDAGIRPKALCIDASNERFFAQRVRREFSGLVPVHLIVSGENVIWKGGEYNFKQLLGNLYVSAIEDNLMEACPDEWWLEDHRLVKRDRGTYQADTGKDGGHGDVFDGGKLSLWAIEGVGGAAMAEAASVGGLSRETSDDDGIFGSQSTLPC